MDKTITVFLLILLSLLTLMCSLCTNDLIVNAETIINAESVEDYNIAAANNAFAFDMYSKMKSNNENIFFSPYSIFSAIAICYDGAEGTTKKQIANVFYFPLDKSILEVSLREMIDEINSETDDYELETANALWIQKSYPIKKQYISNVDKYYSGKVEKLDFGGQPEKSRNIINEWVEEKTNDKIRDLVPESTINKDTRLIITNAIYFNGKWLNGFDKQATSNEKFYLSEKEEVTVDTMYMKRHLNYGENLNAKIIELPYNGDNLSMCIVLPNKNNIENFENSFSARDYEKLKSKMDSKYEVKTWIPKFKFETRTDLSSLLIEMGAEDAFYSGNFSGISEENLIISNVIHQAFVDVQEEGTEAAAATYVEMSVTVEYVKPEPPIREFKADHPFMFFIEDQRTGCILFMGKIEKPEYE
jgi:serpin B